MAPSRLLHAAHGIRAAVWLLLLAGLAAGVSGMALAEDKKPADAKAVLDDKKQLDPKKGEEKAANPLAVFQKVAPENLADLKAMQIHVRSIVEKVSPCVVGVQIGGAAGSGVIVSKDGYVLTAGHVSDKPNRDAILIMSNGKRVKGKTLGANQDIDSGMIKITEKGDWPFVPMGKSSELKKGQWCLAIGHPGGFRPGRTPVVRLGRVGTTNNKAIITDCVLVGGDSGGPLFDLEGKVIGIHSRIGGTTSTNVHVPVDTYQETWERLVKAEVWGGPGNKPYLGVLTDSERKDCTIKSVDFGSAADKGGMKPKDVIIKFAGAKIETYEDLGKELAKKKPGDKVEIEVLRDKETLKLNVTLGKRS